MKVLTHIPINFMRKSSYSISPMNVLIHIFELTKLLLDKGFEIHCLLEFEIDFQTSDYFSNIIQNRVKFVMIDEINNNSNYDFFMGFDSCYKDVIARNKLNQRNFCKSDKNKYVVTGWGSCSFEPCDNSELIHYVMYCRDYTNGEISRFAADHTIIPITNPGIMDTLNYNPIFNNIVIATSSRLTGLENCDYNMEHNWIKTLYFFEDKYSNIIFDFFFDPINYISDIDNSAPHFFHKHQGFNMRLCKNMPYFEFMEFFSKSLGYIHPKFRDNLSRIMYEASYMGLPVLFSQNVLFGPYSTFPSMANENDYIIAIDMIEKMIQYSEWYKNQMKMENCLRDDILISSISKSDYEINNIPDESRTYYPKTFDLYKRMQLSFQKEIKDIVEDVPNQISSFTEKIKKAI